MAGSDKGPDGRNVADRGGIRDPAKGNCRDEVEWVDGREELTEREAVRAALQFAEFGVIQRRPFFDAVPHSK